MSRDNFGNWTYVVVWPRHGITKAGVTANAKRWKGFLAKGAEIVELERWGQCEEGSVDYEQAILGMFERYMPHAFTDRFQAVPFLGSQGAGYTECFYAVKGAPFVHGLLEAWDSGLLD